MTDQVHHQFAPPRIALICSAIMATLAFVAAIAGSYGEVGVYRMAESPAVDSRLLKIENASDFSARVTDAETGRLIHVAKLGPEEGFIWGAVNGLSYGRKQRQGPLDAPYDLARRADGRLTLTDTVTGQKVFLDSFGPSNALAFSRLLDAAKASQAVQAPQAVEASQALAPGRQASAQPSGAAR